jgi:hypothetical protein
MPPDPTSDRYRSLLRHVRGMFCRFGPVLLALLEAWKVSSPLSSSAAESICCRNHSPTLSVLKLWLIAGAFIIALATILIYFIFTPRKRSQSREVHHTRVYEPLHTPARWPGVMPTLPLVPAKENAKNLRNTVATVN